MTSPITEEAKQAASRLVETGQPQPNPYLGTPLGEVWRSAFHCHHLWLSAASERASGVLAVARVLNAHDPFCPKCGHNRDVSSVSSIDHGAGRHSCQKCGTEWIEVAGDVGEVQK